MVDDFSYSLLLLALFGCLLLVLIRTSGALVRAARALELADQLERELRALGEQVRQLSERVEGLAAQASIAPDTEGLARARDDEAWQETVRGMQAAAPSPEGDPAAETQPAWPNAAPLPRTPLERRIAAHWFLYIGMGLTAVGGVWLLEYLVSRDWLAAPIRAAAGAALSVGLLALGERAAGRGQTPRSRLLIGTALVVLYASAWTIGPGSWLLSRWPAFALLASVSALAVVETVRHRAIAFAAIALGTGFVTPVLMGPEHVPLALLAYIGGLIVVARWLAHRASWPLLDISAYLLTAWVLIWWTERSWSRDQWWMLELFLTAYLVLFLIAWREARGATIHDARLRTFQRWACIALASAPVLYHVASVAILVPHAGVWLVYAIVVTLAGLVAAARLHSTLVRWLTFAGVAVPLAAWCYTSFDREWFLAGVIAVVAVSALHLVSEWEALGERQITDSEIALSHLNAWWTFVALGLLLAPRLTVWPLLTGVPLVVAHVALGAGWWRRYREASRHHLGIALAFGATAGALWAGGFAATVALALEGAVLLSLAASRTPLRIAGEALLALAYFSALHALATPTSPMAPSVVNPRTGPALVVVAVLMIAWWRLGRRDHATAGGPRSTRAALLLGAHLLIVLALTMEVAVWLQHQALDAAAFEASTRARSWQTAQLIGPTMLWAAYGCVLVAAGIWRRHAALRYLGVTLAIVALGKLCVTDFPAIGPVARLVSALALGGVLLTMAYLYRATTMEPLVASKDS